MATALISEGPFHSFSEAPPTICSPLASTTGTAPSHSSNLPSTKIGSLALGANARRGEASLAATRELSQRLCPNKISSMVQEYLNPELTVLSLWTEMYIAIILPVPTLPIGFVLSAPPSE
ncbi:MAG: hypothetical protein DDT40_01784 [candidate division WS2 bacterium]|nr:hypothetical protein [Candidatus Psychracetigena formicireducens]